MKHLRFINLLVIVLLLAAWAPAPQSLFSEPPVSAQAYSATIGSMSPITGVKQAVWPTFKWKITFTTAPTTVIFQVSKNSTFTDLLINDDTVAVLGNSVLYNYLVDAVAHPLPSNVKLFWRVRACNGDVAVATNCKNSAALYLLAKPYKVTTVISPVDGATNLTTLRPALAWEPEGDPRAASYNIQLAKDPDFKIGVLNYTTKQTYFEIPVDLVKGIPYYWHVRPVGLAVGDYSDPAWSFNVPNLTPPAQPVLTYPVNASAVPTYTPTLKWKSTFAGSDFYLQFSPDALFLPTSTQNFMLTEADGVTKDASGVWNFTIPPELALPTMTAFWRIQAVDLTAGMVSAWSKPFSFKTPSELQIVVADPLGDFITVPPSGPTPIVPKPMEGTTVTVSTKTTCPIAVNNPSVIASGTTQADGTLTLRGITGGTRYVCVTDDVNHYYAPFRKTMTIAAGKVYVPPVTLFNMVHPQMKVVFTWGATPRDMDTQLWLPETLPTGEDPVHLYSDGMRGTDLKTPWAKIMNDAYGTATLKTETLLIKNRYPGKYYYAVLNKNKDFDPALNIKFKDTATVKVYMMNGATWELKETYKPAAEPTGRFWHVFDFDGMTGILSRIPAENEFLTLEQARTVFPYDYDGGLGASAMLR